MRRKREREKKGREQKKRDGGRRSLSPVHLFFLSFFSATQRGRKLKRLLLFFPVASILSPSLSLYLLLSAALSLEMKLFFVLAALSLAGALQGVQVRAPPATSKEVRRVDSCNARHMRNGRPSPRSYSLPSESDIFEDILGRKKFLSL